MTEETDEELLRRMREQAITQCANILLVNDHSMTIALKAWMAGAQWMLYELRPDTNS